MNTPTAQPMTARVIDAPPLTQPPPDIGVQQMRLIPIPETQYVPRQRAANLHIYHLPKRPPAPAPVAEPNLGFWAREARKFCEASQKLWSDIKPFGRKCVHKTVRWVVIPLAIVASLGAAIGEPSELHPTHLRTLVWQK